MYKIAFIIAVVIISVNTAQALPGSGTQHDPYRIESLEDFNDFAADPNYWDDHTRLETDVNLAGQIYTTAVVAPDTDNTNWGFDGTPFTGVFDGNGYKITALTIDDEGVGNDYLGLFGYNQGEITNLGVEAASVTGTGQFVGALVANNDAATVSNCYATGDVNVTAGRYVGGMVGWNTGSVANCYSAASVSGTADNVGGLVGYNQFGSVSNCYSAGEVTGVSNVGGLAGDNNAGSVANCYSAASVSGTADNIGGLIGWNYRHPTWHKGDVSSCYSTGSVTGGQNSQFVGGLIGWDNEGVVSNCYSTGEVSGGQFVGGLMGENDDGTVQYCYSTGDVSGQECLGGLVGENNGIVLDCFWDTETQTHGVTDSIGEDNDTVINVHGLPTAQMQTRSTFTDAGWVFFSIWSIFEGTDYPRLVMGQIPAPVVHYGFDETSGNITRDSTGGNDGVVSGGTWATPGAIAATGPGHLKFSDGVVKVPNLGTAVLDFTISVWVNKAPFDTGGDSESGEYPTLVASMSKEYNSWGDILEGIFEEGGDNYQGRVMISVAGVEYEYEPGETDFRSGVWQHVALVRDAATGIVTMYLNAATTYIFECGPGPVDFSIFRIGNTIPGRNRNIAGGWDDFGFWDKQLPQGAPEDAAGRSIYGVYEKGVRALVVPEIEFASAASGDLESVSPAGLTVLLNSPEEGQTYTVDYAAVGGTATAGVDYIMAGAAPACWNWPAQCHGDTDNDGEVKGSDFLALKNSWYKCVPDPDYNPCADFDRDGCVKGSDFLILKNNWYQTVEANCPPEGGPATLTFNPGETSKAISIEIIDDGLDEEDETIVVALSNPTSTGADLVLGEPNEHTYTIEDTRPGVGFQIDSSSGWEDVSPADITVNLSFASTKTVTVDYAATGGTATGGGVDYTLDAGTLTFNPGETSKTISIAVVDDGVVEDPETVVITLSNPDNAKLRAITEHTYTIVDPSIITLHLKVDLAHPVVEGSSEARPGTAKEGWTAWVEPAWWDMYMHDFQTFENIDGTGIGAGISITREGNGALIVHGMYVRPRSGQPALGQPVGDPIANTWYCNFDWGGNPRGNIVLIFYCMPAGTYTLKSYHNWWVFCGDGTWMCTPTMPPMPRVWALGLVDADKGALGLYGYEKLVNAAGDCLGNPGGVQLIQDATDVMYTTTQNDDEVATSEISFRTDGSAVLVIYEAPYGWTDPRGRDGGRGILNAFELQLVGP